MTAAFEITNLKDWQDSFDITVYQMGWRLGGKGASGRNRRVANRIEEHGLHVWMGFYENAFHVIRQLYDDCAARKLTPDSPFQNWQQAFIRQDFGTNMEKTPAGWVPWTIHFPPNDQLPGEAALFDRKEPPPTAWDALTIVIEWIVREFAAVEDRFAGSGPSLLPEWLRSALHSLAVEAEGTALHMLARLVKSLDPDPARHSEETRNTLIGLLEHIAGTIVRDLEEFAERDATLRRALYLVDSGIAMARGMIVDEVFTRGFDAIDRYDLMEWLKNNGCRHPDNPFVRAGYDALFAYRNGDPRQPEISAATAVLGMLRMMCTYRGSMFWRMAAGMGDTIFAPAYLALKARGVKFEFFHRVANVALNADKSLVDTVTFDVQAEQKDPGRGYDPLIFVKGLPCWPDEPDYDQLKDGDRIKGHNIESDYTAWRGQLPPRTIRRGVDFDDVLLGIPPAASRWICTELAGARPEWAAMFENVATVQTQAVQLWLHETSADLGYPPPSSDQKPAVTAFVEPFDTWADMTHLLPAESWEPADNVQSIAYLCNALEDSPAIPPPFTDPAFPASQLSRVRSMALDFLSGKGDVQALWPKCGLPFRWDLLVDRGAGAGEARLDSQFLRANIDGTERYTLSLKGTSKFRLDPGKSGFTNLFLAGDWTYNVLNAGCVEAAVISGRLASRAICGKPDYIYGAFHSKEEIPPPSPALPTRPPVSKPVAPPQSNAGEQVRAHWTHRVMRGMPPKVQVGAHCRAIAAKYAMFFQQHPEIYPWAGIAAFAVHRIGMALTLYEFEIFEGTVTKIAEDYDHPHGAEVLFNDLNHLRLANNEFFEDVGWTLEAYVAPDGGIEAIKRGLEGYAGHENLLEAFLKIDEGRKLLSSPATRAQGEAAIWAGSLLIEYHGQVYSAQKFYDSVDHRFDLFMTVFTAMNFEAASFGIERWKFTAFDLYMWTLGIPKLIRTLSLPDLRSLDQRWYWIVNRVFPIWKRVVERDPALKRNIAAIVRAAEFPRAATA
ncbi:MAG: NAD(P)-binding protein [Bryobacteraceae bacterium]|nr:NAD(P)-binding protein [Bryobacteraceae bacterium]